MTDDTNLNDQDKEPQPKSIQNHLDELNDRQEVYELERKKEQYETRALVEEMRRNLQRIEVDFVGNQRISERYQSLEWRLIEMEREKLAQASSVNQTARIIQYLGFLLIGVFLLILTALFFNLSARLDVVDVHIENLQRGLVVGAASDNPTQALGGVTAVTATVQPSLADIPQPITAPAVDTGSNPSLLVTLAIGLVGSVVAFFLQRQSNPASDTPRTTSGFTIFTILAPLIVSVLIALIGIVPATIPLIQSPTATATLNSLSLVETSEAEATAAVRLETLNAQLSGRTQTAVAVTATDEADMTNTAISILTAAPSPTSLASPTITPQTPIATP